MEKIRVLVVDDSFVVRRVVTDELAAQPDIEVAGTAMGFTRNDARRYWGRGADWYRVSTRNVLRRKDVAEVLCEETAGTLHA